MQPMENSKHAEHNEKAFQFDKRAANYDEVEGKISARFYKLLLEQVTLQEGAAVLDVGCGTGTILRRMADLCPINGYGIDVEQNMVTEAKKKCPEMEVLVSKCEDTPFADQTFDVLTVCMAYHHFDDKKGFAKEAARILKENGCLYIADPRFPFVIRKTINGVLRVFRVTGFFGTPEEIYENFREYGFVLNKVTAKGYAQVCLLKKNC